MAGAYAATVFVVVPIEDVVAAIFDRPMPPIHLKDTLGIGLFGGSAGDAVGDFMGVFPGLFVDRFPFDDEGLSDVGEVEVAVERGGGPDRSGFDPPMLGRGVLDELRFVSVLEEAGDIVKQCWLVAFDSGSALVGPRPGSGRTRVELRAHRR